MYPVDEVRDFQQVPKGDKVKVSDKELKLGVGLTDRLTSQEFHPENYKDEYRIRVLGMLDEKSKGKEIVIDKAPAPKHGQVIDIMEALKRSMERLPAKKKAGTTAKKRKVIPEINPPLAHQLHQEGLHRLFPLRSAAEKSLNS